MYEPEKRSDRTANQIASLTGHMTVLANVKNLNCIYINRPRRKTLLGSTLLKMMHKKARKQFAEDKQIKHMGY